MPTSDQIKRISPDPDGLDFKSLKKEGIAKAQNLCGDIWTDYNAHDPGVTILEQLCYGLTDLSYRSEFEIQDYLTGQNGKVNYKKQGLLSPEEIFPSSPVTTNDYQKILFDAIPDIANILFKPLSVSKDGNALKGLFSVFIKLNDQLTFKDKTTFNQNDRLSELSKKLKDLRRLSDKRSETLDQLGDSLDTQHERIEQNLLPEHKEFLFEIKKFLSQLDSNLSLLERTWEQFDFIWSELLGAAGNATLISNSGLDGALDQFDKMLRDHSLFSPLESALSELNAPLFMHDNLFSMSLNKLEMPLKSFGASLCDLEKKLSVCNAKLLKPDNAPDLVSMNQKEDAIKQKVIAFFAKHRNLCEDIHSVKIVKTEPYFLVGELLLEPLCDLDKIYAEILFKCGRYISSGIRIERYEAILKEEKNYEEIFSGPLTEHGYIPPHSFEPTRTSVRVVDLIELINQIDGIRQVRNLSLMDKENKRHQNIPRDLSLGRFPSLCFPEMGKPMQMLQLTVGQNAHVAQRVKKNSFDITSDYKDNQLLKETKLELEKLNFEYNAFRRNTRSLEQLIKLPKGQRRNLQSYKSIQNEFPAIYGINRYGVQPSAKLEEKIKAKQLKAYLFPFEQLMANYLKGLQEISQLFSLDAELEQSYFSQYLDNQNVPDIETLYVGDATQTQQLSSEIHSYYDNFGERRNRVLDTLLAMYGEEFPQQSLTQFNYYRKTETNHWLIAKKIHYLKHIQEISRDRAKGFNYLESPGDVKNVASIKVKVYILLGLDKARNSQFMTKASLNRMKSLVSDEKYKRQVKFVKTDNKTEYEPILHDRNTNPKYSLLTKIPLFSETVLKEGIDLNNYKLVRDGQVTAVCFKPINDDRLWLLANKDKSEAAQYVHQFCHTITRINMECEKLHIVEHILLRPYGNDAFKKIQDYEVLFINCRVSVIFPSWTARFSDDEFRRYAEETVQRNLPAHICAEFFWLDFIHMRNFEKQYKKWQHLLKEVKHGNDDQVEELNKASKNIRLFLKKNKSFNKCEYWV